METTDRIEKKIVLRAARARVWRAISDAREFGTWFGVELDGVFAAGKPIKGRIVPTKVDDEVAKLQKPHEGKAFEIVVDRIEHERLFSFHWHPYAVDDKVAYANEPSTLVTFELVDTDKDGVKGTLLTISESGFDGIPLARRATAFAANDAGWAYQAKLIEKYLAHAG